MKTTKKPLLIPISLFILILSLLLTSVAYAGTSSTNGGVGDANCTASKTINQGSSSWTAYVRSQCDLGIGKIGYTWWTVRQYCVASGGYTTRFQSAVGDVNTDTNTFQRVFSGIPYVLGCGSGYIQLQDLGKHDFRTIINTWQPTVNRYENRVY
jgi:hypothetical protein